MPHPVAPTLGAARPLEWIGGLVLGAFAYLGGLAGLFVASLARRPDAWKPRAILAELNWMLRLGLPTVAVVFVGIGSFLSMQSYFGGTFVDGTGAVVGVGLIRNVAPLMACLTLTGVIAARITPELRAVRGEPGRERGGFLERTAAPPSPPRPAIDPAGLAGPRLIAAMIAGLVVSVWAVGVGTLVGWQVAQSMLGVSTYSFFQMYWDMLWMRDVVGLMVKAPVFGLAAALLACHEGLRGEPGAGLEAVSAATCRAACLAAVAIMVVNSGWFILVYHAGPAFGPTLMAAPSS